MTTDLSVGTHTITFKVKDNEGLWSEPVYSTVKINKITTEYDYPVAIANGPYTAYLNNTITFDASESYDNDSTIIEYRWNFGDGNTAEGKIVTHTYTEEKQYNVTLTITNNYGLKDTKTTTATILPQSSGQQNKDEIDNDKIVIPGFELISLLLVIITLLIIKKRKNYFNKN
jgi:PKD repeat protein